MAYDGKYGRVTTEFGDIGEEEPVIVFRAKDRLAPLVIRFYRNMCEENESPQHHLDLITQAHHTFRAWQQQHGDRMPTSDSHKERLGL